MTARDLVEERAGRHLVVRQWRVVARKSAAWDDRGGREQKQQQEAEVSQAAADKEAVEHSQAVGDSQAVVHDKW